jgi:hypothetical protein
MLIISFMILYAPVCTVDPACMQTEVAIWSTSDMTQCSMMLQENTLVYACTSRGVFQRNPSINVNLLLRLMYFPEQNITFVTKVRSGLVLCTTE